MKPILVLFLSLMLMGCEYTCERFPEKTKSFTDKDGTIYLLRYNGMCAYKVNKVPQ
jgi:hypothetical protein